MEKVIRIGDSVVKMWLTEVEESAREQVENLASLPFVYHHIALMPDCHAGMGMPIGGVLATDGVVIPNAVGVDIGCGMCAVKTDIQVSDISQDVLRKGIMSGIRDRIPLGMEHHKERQDESLMPQGFDIEKTTIVKNQYLSALKQIGTLGGGNHFIELQRDGDGFLWIMLHSGSRNLGKKVCDYYDKMARNLNEMWRSVVPTNIQLAFLPVRSKEFTDYWNEMLYCVEFALCNRRLMMHRIQEVIQDHFPNCSFEPMINIAHNYAAWENHFGHNCIVHRKGAVRAREGEIGIIPGSQGTCSYIVEGLGNPDSFMSSSHGAGRLMSRTQAINTLDLEAEIRLMESKGIVHGIRSQRDLDEAASAYKDIDQVIALEADLVKIKTKLEPIAVIKG
ncbi:MAG: RtcB family protein [Bacteroidales bacterium]|nr:RtcB family protein [Bacteroidales bacterium]